MELYAGIDVSLNASSVCVVDAEGTLVKEAKVASEPQALIAFSRACLRGRRRSAWKRGRCRNGCLRGCGRRGSTLS